MSACGPSSSPATVASSAAGVCANVGARAALAPAEGIGAPALGRLTTYGATAAKGAPRGAPSDSHPPSGAGAEQPSRHRLGRLWHLRAHARSLSSRASVRMCGICGVTTATPGSSTLEHTVYRQTYLNDGTAFGLPMPTATLVSERNRAQAPSVAFVRTPAGRSRVAGLMACGSVHECPTCRDRIASVRAREIQTATNTHRDRGGVVIMATLNVRHRWGMTAGLIREVPRVFGAMRKDRRWREWWQALELGRVEVRTRKVRRRLGAQTTRETYGEVAPGIELEEDSRGRLCEVRTVEYRHVCMDYVRAAEQTHGENGWHPHLHVLVFLERAPNSMRALARIRGELAEMWGDTVARELGESHRPSRRRGVHLKVCKGDIGDYLSKLGLEIASDLDKRSSGGRTPLELLEDSSTGDLEARALWRQYTSAVLGMRQLTWSRGTRKNLALPEELDDEEVARERDDASDERVLELPTKTWAKVLAPRVDLVMHLLGGIREADDVKTAREWAWLVLRRELGDDACTELVAAEATARALRRRHERAMDERAPMRGWSSYAFSRSIRYDGEWKGGRR